MVSKGNKNSRGRFSYGYTYSNYQRFQFNVNDYIQNQPMIEKLYEEKEFAYDLFEKIELELINVNEEKIKLELQEKELNVKLNATKEIILGLENDKSILSLELNSLRKEKEGLLTDNHLKEIKIAEMEEQISNNGRNSVVQFFVSLIATLVVGIGVNIFTSTPNDWKGWSFGFIGIVLSVIAFFISRKR